MPKKAFGEGSGRFPCKSWVSKFGRKSVSAAGWPPGGLPKAGWLERPGLASSSQGLLLHRTASPSALLSPPEAAFFFNLRTPLAEERTSQPLLVPAIVRAQGFRELPPPPSPLLSPPEAEDFFGFQDPSRGEEVEDLCWCQQ